MTTAASPTTETASWAPTAKVSAGILGGAVTVLVLALVHHYVGKIENPEVASALTTVVTFVVQYLTPERGR